MKAIPGTDPDRYGLVLGGYIVVHVYEISWKKIYVWKKKSTFEKAKLAAVGECGAASTST